MFFPIDAAEWKKALGQVRRLRSRGNLERISSSDSYWTSAFFAALVESVDYLLLEDPQQALELSRQGILLAGRMRAVDCPGGDEVGKRSLAAWAQAVHGSACRVLERYRDAEAAFQQASWLATSKPVLPWAAGEVWRRYAALLFYQGSLSSFDYAERALACYKDYPAARADTLVAIGLFHQYLRSDLSAAAREIGKAIEILQPKRSARERRTWSLAIHNLSLICTRNYGDLATVATTLKQLRRASSKLSNHDIFRRMLFAGVEALLLAILGSSRQAARLLARSCRWFFRHGYYHRGAIAAVDLALLHLRDGDRPAALEVLNQLAEDVAPAPPEVKNFHGALVSLDLALLCLREGNQPEALAILRRHLVQSPAPAAVKTHLEKWLETWSASGRSELDIEDLEPFRDILSFAASQPREKPQPLGTTLQPNSSSSPESEEDPGSPAASGVASTAD